MLSRGALSELIKDEYVDMSILSELSKISNMLSRSRETLNNKPKNLVGDGTALKLK
jgi:hypothetical protein